jgi:hypothetical protein
MIPSEILLVWFLIKFCLCDSWWSFDVMIPSEILTVWFLTKFCLCDSWWSFVSMIPSEILLVRFLMKFCLCDSWWSFISMIPHEAYGSPLLTICIITQVRYNALYKTSIMQLQVHNTWLPAIPVHVLAILFQLSGRIAPHTKSLPTQYSWRYPHPI